VEENNLVLFETFLSDVFY